MKPTLQQTQLLKKYLRNLLDYRETYEEIYDHILSAVESNTTDEPFAEAVNNIIKTNFGGAKGLIKIEKQHYKAVVNEVVKQQWLQFTQSFKFPEVLLSLLLFAAIYFIVIIFSAQATAIVIFLFALCIMPGVFVLFRYFRIGYAIKDTKKSIKDGILGQLASKPVLLGNPGIFILIGKSEASLWITGHPLITSLIIAVVTLYVLAFIKLCRRDIKAYSLL
jgi:hypothetical protein